MNAVRNFRGDRLSSWPTTLGIAVTLLALASPLTAADKGPTRQWNLPEAREVALGGPLGEAYDRGVKRLALPPYDSAVYLRSDFSFETNRIFVNYSGDISGRFIQIASLVSPPGQMTPPALSEVLNGLPNYQKADGHFGRDVDWNQPLEPENSNAVLLPMFWGNSRLLAGLIEAHRAFGREDYLAAARRIGDFYIATAGRFLDPAREPEYRMTGSYAAGYVTDYFPGIEGLALLYQTTRDSRYLRQAERMADFFSRFDGLPIDHSHGNLVTHYGLLLLYEITGKPEYLRRPLAQWQKAVAGGFVWPTGGVGERFRVSCGTDEGCSEADWLRLNLRLWALTSETRFLDQAERLLWDSVGRAAAVAFIFDLIAVPEDLTTESLPASAGTTQGQFFSKKEYTPHPLPTFAALRDQVPAPVCDAKPVWIQTYWKAWELAFRNFHEPAAGSGYVSQFIDAAFNQN